MSIPLIIVIIYVAILFAISFWVKRRAAAGATGYILAGRQLTAPLITVSIVGLAIGGASTIGVSEQAYKIGLSAGWYTVAWGIGAVVMGALVARKYRELNVATIPEMLERYYDQKGMIAGVICQIVIQLVITSLQYIAGGSILNALLPDIFSLQTGMLASAVVFIGITFIGGMWSASISNILNIVLIYGGILISTVVCVYANGGLQAIGQKLPAASQYFDLVGGVGIKGIASWILVMVTVNISLQSIVQISLSAKDVKTAQRGFVVGGLMMLPIGFVAALMGIIAKGAYPETSAALALPKMIMSLHPVLAGVTLAALWAADISTACNLLLSSATLFSQDTYKRFINPKVSDAKYLLVTKLTVLVLGLLTLGLAMTLSGIIQTIMVALSLTAAFSTIVLFTFFAPQLCRRNSAFYTIVVSLAVLVMWQTVPAIRILPHVIYLEWIACVATFLLVYVLDTAPIKTIAKQPVGAKQ